MEVDLTECIQICIRVTDLNIQTEERNMKDREYNNFTELRSDEMR